MSEETTPAQHTLGQTLVNARLAKNVSLELIAEQLKLTPLQIERIEMDDYLTLGPETFVRGYIKGYCRLVDLDSDSVLALYVGPPAPEKRSRMKSFSRRTEKEAHDSRLMWVSYLIMALVIGSSVFWWWQTTSTHKDVSSLPSPAIEAAAPQVDLGTTESPLTSNVDTMAGQPESIHSESIRSESIDDAIAGDAGNPMLAESAVVNEAVTSPIASANIDSTPANTVTNTATTTTDAAPESSEVSKPQNNSIARPALSTIEMQFGEDSWVEIFDATSERVAFGIKKAGYTMTVAGKAPFSVVLAKHQKVAVSLDGEPVDLSYLPKNKLAKFKLPLAE